ncbi:hypothetical protein AJ79_03149 [Helicocarpus griseus UAMH5409]|uniref:Uncharacterized protein n=1 Tax=Helicocarpus griseus UAMH5409 TaxID=1447875 RepID=A0A2B7Y0T1_9EURO|nr:hypothetical protein AJ79_03149 [Helicocarpus griseus UAMH5409]
MAVDIKTRVLSHDSKVETPNDSVTRMPGVALEDRVVEMDAGGGQHVYGNKKGLVVGQKEVDDEGNNWLSSVNLTYNNKYRRRVLMSATASFSEVAIPLIAQMPDIELRLISDDALSLTIGAGKAAVYVDTPTPGQLGSKLSSRPWMNMTATELIDWADVLILGAMDAGTLGAMLAGLTTTLTLTVLRGWDVSKPVLLIPGMTTAEWQFPLTKRQFTELATSWPWVRVLQPILSKLESAKNLVEIPWDEWAAFGNEVRKCLGRPFTPSCIQGDEKHINNVYNGNGSIVNVESNGVHGNEQPHSKKPSPNGAVKESNTATSNEKPTLPPEILSMIFETLDDWEVATSVGVYAKIPIPEKWKPYIPKPGSPSTLEYTILRGSIKEIELQISKIPTFKRLSKIDAHLILKFARTDILNYLVKSRMDLILSTSELQHIPLYVSTTYNSTALLTWWVNYSSALPPFNIRKGVAECVDAASRAGFVEVLEWWRQSGFPFRYTERALESASAEGRIAVLDWWKNVSKSAPLDDPVPLKVGKSVLLAAQSGQTKSLAWWDKSDIPYGHAESVTRIASNHGHVPVLDFWHQRKREKLIFDNQVLVGATKNGHVDVLEWWKRSGLPVEFKTCDIEEALEDAVSGVEQRVRRWWARNGLNLGVGTNEWMMVKTLNT